MPLVRVSAATTLAHASLRLAQPNLTGTPTFRLLTVVEHMVKCQIATLLAASSRVAALCSQSNLAAIAGSAKGILSI